MATKRTEEAVSLQEFIEEQSYIDSLEEATEPVADAYEPIEGAYAVPTNSVDVQSILDAIDLEAIIKQRVEQQVAEAVERQSHHQGNPIVDATQRGTKSFTPEKYLKHYRCDVSPDIQILRRNYNADEDKMTGTVKGEWMKFRRGHFFAKTQEEVDQIEWMIRHPQLDPTDNLRVIGGNPTIYEDDGKDLVACAYCGEAFVAGSNSLKSHLRATHGVDI